MNTFPPIAPGAVAPKEPNLWAAISLVHQHLFDSYGDPNECSTSYLLAPTDEYGWGDGESPVLMWEEGPYEWVNEVSMNDDLIAKLKPLGYFAEPVTSWALSFYQI